MSGLPREWHEGNRLIPTHGGALGIAATMILGGADELSNLFLLPSESPLLCFVQVLDAGTPRPSTRGAAGVREAPRHEIAGCGQRRGSGRYGDLTAA